MKPRTIGIATSLAPVAYDIVIGSGLLTQSAEWTKKCLGPETDRIVIVSNPTVFALYGRRTERALRAAGFALSTFLMKDGERYKNLRSVEAALKFFTEKKISRTDAVVALGGGVVGDLAGFAAAVHLRGIPFLQIPTTLLAMIDSSVGGKTGVNTASGKNRVGAFHQPRGVLIDVSVLKTLPRRELTAGFCEAIKQGAIASKDLLGRTHEVLAALSSRTLAHALEGSNFGSEIANLISAQVEFKAKIVACDERESSKRVDARSRKILNFGHTLAHALEKVTDYKRLRHGEAVGYGILFAAELSKSLALCSEKDVNLLYDVVHRAGPLPSISDIDTKELFRTFRTDKKNVGGVLQMVLLKGIGRPVIVTEADVPRPSLRGAFETLLQKMA